MSEDLILNTKLSFSSSKSKHHLYEHLKQGRDTKERGWAAKEFMGEFEGKKTCIVIQFALLSSYHIDGLTLLEHAWNISKKTIARYTEVIICNLFAKKERIQSQKRKQLYEAVTNVSKTVSIREVEGPLMELSSLPSQNGGAATNIPRTTITHNFYEATTGRTDRNEQPNIDIAFPFVPTPLLQMNAPIYKQVQPDLPCIASFRPEHSPMLSEVPALTESVTERNFLKNTPNILDYNKPKLWNRIKKLVKDCYNAEFDLDLVENEDDVSDSSSLIYATESSVSLSSNETDTDDEDTDKDNERGSDYEGKEKEFIQSKKLLRSSSKHTRSNEGDESEDDETSEEKQQDNKRQPPKIKRFIIHKSTKNFSIPEDEKRRRTRRRQTCEEWRTAIQKHPNTSTAKAALQAATKVLATYKKRMDIEHEKRTNPISLKALNKANQKLARTARQLFQFLYLFTFKPAEQGCL